MKYRCNLRSTANDTTLVSFAVKLAYRVIVSFALDIFLYAFCAHFLNYWDNVSTEPPTLRNPPCPPIGCPTRTSDSKLVGGLAHGFSNYGGQSFPPNLQLLGEQR